MSINSTRKTVIYNVLIFSEVVFYLLDRVCWPPISIFITFEFDFCNRSFNEVGNSSTNFWSRGNFFWFFFVDFFCFSDSKNGSNKVRVLFWFDKTDNFWWCQEIFIWGEPGSSATDLTFLLLLLSLRNFIFIKKFSVRCYLYKLNYQQDASLHKYDGTTLRHNTISIHLKTIF